MLEGAWAYSRFRRGIATALVGGLGVLVLEEGCAHTRFGFRCMGLGFGWQLEVEGQVVLVWKSVFTVFALQ